MAEKRVVLVVHADGHLEVEAQGFKGKECDQDEVLKGIQQLLAPESKSEQKKPEYYQEQQKYIVRGR